MRLFEVVPLGDSPIRIEVGEIGNIVRMALTSGRWYLINAMSAIGNSMGDRATDHFVLYLNMR